MHNLIKATLAIAALAAAPPAYAQDAEDTSDITISGNVALTSQYRLRGISQSDEDIALQGGVTVSHSSGVYAGAWASSLAGFGSFGGANLELDLIAGYSTKVGAATLDGGLIYYVYPGTSGTDFIDLYASVSAPVGPVTAKLGAYYAPSSDALGNDDNIWVFTDLAAPIPDTPVTLKGHIGYTSGALGGPDGDYIDYSVGVDVAIRNLTLNVSYVDTDIGKAAANAFYAPGGHTIVDGAVVATLTASF
jgi:uncharacterized protein (TIGR02001 family)